MPFAVRLKFPLNIPSGLELEVRLCGVIVPPPAYQMISEDQNDKITAESQIAKLQLQLARTQSLGHSIPLHRRLITETSTQQPQRILSG